MVLFLNAKASLQLNIKEQQRKNNAETISSNDAEKVGIDIWKEPYI